MSQLLYQPQISKNILKQNTGQCFTKAYHVVAQFINDKIFWREVPLYFKILLGGVLFFFNYKQDWLKLAVVAEWSNSPRHALNSSRDRRLGPRLESRLR